MKVWQLTQEDEYPVPQEDYIFTDEAKAREAADRLGMDVVEGTLDPPMPTGLRIFSVHVFGLCWPPEKWQVNALSWRRCPAGASEGFTLVQSTQYMMYADVRAETASRAKELARQEAVLRQSVV